MGARTRTYDVLSRETGRYITTTTYSGFEIEERLRSRKVVFVDCETGAVLW
jgi:hypothetical protein